MTPRVRLAVLVVAITLLPVLLYTFHVVDAHGLRDFVHQAGPWAPLAWVVVSAALGAALFPGPVLAGAGGLLFGAAVGTITTVISAVLSALVSREIGRRAGYDGAAEILGPRASAMEHIGFRAVLVQRLAPGIPDGPLSYAFGALGVTRRDLALGTALGTLPRAFSYTAIGASLDHPSSPLALAGIAGVIVSALVGIAAARHMHLLYQTNRRLRMQEDSNKPG
ncbi:MAG: hypothetical protein QOD70_1483 [Frankiales bacterium]|nr:hypothetical protein [Frankiales bacterium]